MNVYFCYIISWAALSGLGLTFLNPESLLALCFFIFFALCLQHSEPIADSLQHATQATKSALLSCMVDGQKHSSTAKKLRLFKMMQLSSAALSRRA